MRDWSEKHRKYSETLNEYGWFAPSYILGSDFDRLEKTLQPILDNPPNTEKARLKAENAIHLSIMDAIFHPNFRARLIWHGMKVPHFQEFSHIVEMAIFSYYKREYAASILLLLCAIEGVLRSWSQLDDPKYPQLKEAVKKAPLHSQSPKEHATYRDALAVFLDQWIYRYTGDADFSISVLNRHYVMHGKKPGNFYRPQDMHRMMLATDLLLDFLSYSTETFDTVFLPDEGGDFVFDSRRDYYHALSEGDQTFKQTWRTERKLLSDHKNYVASDDKSIPNMETSRLMALLDYLSASKKLS